MSEIPIAELGATRAQTAKGPVYERTASPSCLRNDNPEGGRALWCVRKAPVEAHEGLADTFSRGALCRAPAARRAQIMHRGSTRSRVSLEGTCIPDHPRGADSADPDIVSTPDREADPRLPAGSLTWRGQPRSPP
jgi:hypothetical protein